METLTKILKNTDEMEQEAKAFVEALPIQNEGATLITLSGDLGVGKTAFTQFVAKALGIIDIVNSPTFVIEKIYNIPENSRFNRLVHVDAYRLKDSGELTALGFGQIMSHTHNLVMLEWPENVLGISEHASVRILLEALPDGSRQITYA